MRRLSRLGSDRPHRSCNHGCSLHEDPRPGGHTFADPTPEDRLAPGPVVRQDERIAIRSNAIRQHVEAPNALSFAVPGLTSVPRLGHMSGIIPCPKVSDGLT